MSSKKKTTTPLHDLVITAKKVENWHIVILNGKFVVKSSALVRNHFDKAEAASPKTKPQIAIDMSDVTQVDSSALTFLLNFQQRLQAKNGKLVIIGPNADIKEMFYLVGFNQAVQIYPTRVLFEKSECA